MPQWSNPPLIVYHGTDDISAGALMASAVRLASCNPRTDFGQGFYTTTRLHQAKQWANQKLLRSSGSQYAVVVAFTLDRDWLSALDTLASVRPIWDFWDLITDCRLGFPPHQRPAPRPLPYDVVYGPVTLWQQRLVIADCDQISFHTSRALPGMGRPKMTADAQLIPGNLFPYGDDPWIAYGGSHDAAGVRPPNFHREAGPELNGRYSREFVLVH